MGGRCSRAKRAKKIFFRPLLGGPEKVDCLVVTNSTNCFMLFIVKCDKIISAASIPIPDRPTSRLHYLAYFLVNETRHKHSKQDILHQIIWEDVPRPCDQKSKPEVNSRDVIK